MSTLRIATAGESHGPAEICVVEGVPAGLGLRSEDIDQDLRRRQQGYGRGGRMEIEADHCRILAGVRLGSTLGSPICLLVENKDHENWLDLMSPELSADDPNVMRQRVTIPRPGHADLAGLSKYGHEDIRNVLERASARETVGRVAGGSVCKRLLLELGVRIHGRVVSVGSISLGTRRDFSRYDRVNWEAVENSPVGRDDSRVTAAMCEEIDQARAHGESLGGIFEIWCWGMCPGLGGFGNPQERLDGRLIGALGSVPAVKGVEIGEGFANSTLVGSKVHDHYVLREDRRGKWIARETNRAGGLEGGITTGMPIVLRAAMKPIPTLTTPLPSVDILTLEPSPAHIERSDVCAVPAARVVGEAMAAIVLAETYLDKFGGDNLAQLRQSVRAYEDALEERGLWRRS